MSIENTLSQMELGVESGLISLETVHDLVAANQTMASQAAHSIRLFSQDLEHALYDNDEFVEIAAKLARKHPSTSVNILVVDSTKAVKLGHRLVELAKRLPSSVFIRKVHSDYADNRESFLLVDDIGIVRRPNPEQFKGFADFKAIPQAPQKERYFQEVWERSSEDPSLRRLSL